MFSPTRIFGSRALTWKVLIAFVSLFPLCGWIQMGFHWPDGILSVIMLMCFTLFLVVNEGVQSGWKITKVSLTKMECLLLIYVLLCVLSTLHSVNPRLSLVGLPQEYNGFLPITCYTILSIWVARRVPGDSRLSLLKYVVLGSIIPSIYGILQHTHWVPAIPYEARSTSFFYNADFFGSYVAIMMVLTLTLLITARRLQALGYLVLLSAQFMAIMYSFTRSAWVGALVGALFLGVTALFHRPRLWKRFSAITAILLVCFMALNHQNHHAISSRAATIPQNAQQVITNHDRNYAGSDRWYIWRESLPIIQRHPLLGTGPDTFKQVFQPPTSGVNKYLGGNPVMANANNAYIQTAVTLGLPAILVILLFYGSILIRSLRSLLLPDTSRTAERNARLTVLGMYGMMLCYLAQAAFNIDVITVAPFFWVILGTVQTKISVNAKKD